MTRRVLLAPYMLEAQKASLPYVALVILFPLVHMLLQANPQIYLRYWIFSVHPWSV